MREALKKLGRRLFGDYSFYYIYYCPASRGPAQLPPPPGMRFAPVNEEQVRAGGEPWAMDQLGFFGPGSKAFACLIGDRIVGLNIHWFNPRYHLQEFWPLGEGQAKSMQIVSAPDMYGKGIGSALLAYGTQQMHAAGFRAVYGRSWHTNLASIRAVERAGWTRLGMVIEIYPFGSRKAWRWRRGLEQWKNT